MKIQDEINKELEWLQKEFGRGKELCAKCQTKRPTQEMPFDKNYELSGEVDKINHILFIYETNLEEAIHTLYHEFIEYLIDTEFVSPYVTLYNHMQRGYEKAFEETAYQRKESMIELIVTFIEGRRRGEK